MVLQFDSLLNLLIFGKNMQVTFDDQWQWKHLESTWNFKWFSKVLKYKYNS